MLKNKYENIKKRGKQKFADHKKYVMGTGGGPSKEIVVTETDSSLYEILGTQLTGLSSQFDSDSAGGLLMNFQSPFKLYCLYQFFLETIILHVEDNDNILEPEASTSKKLKIEENQEKSDLGKSLFLLGSFKQRCTCVNHS